LNRRLLQRWIHVQHGLLILLLAWLIATSPWVHLYNRVPPSPTFWVWGHLLLGVLTLVLSVTFSLTALTQGRLRQYFPWMFGNFRPLLSDLAGLLRLKIPANEGGGLFGVIKGLLLLAMLATGVTGALWWWTAGSSDALTWRTWHVAMVPLLVGLVVLHILATIAHIVQFMRQ